MALVRGGRESAAGGPPLLKAGLFEPLKWILGGSSGEGLWKPAIFMCEVSGWTEAWFFTPAVVCPPQCIAKGLAGTVL